ncbi:response regulator [Herpetosiphon llansteffanensis]
MDSYERRSRFVHRFATPLTTLNAGLALLERYLAESNANSAQIAEVMGLLNRSATRLGSAIDVLQEYMFDHATGIQVIIPDEVLAQRPQQSNQVPAEAPNPVLPKYPPDIDTSKPCVLLIEDSQTYRAVVSARLTQSGYNVVTAPDGMAGLDLARAYQPVAIILDLMLPHLNGEQVAFVLGEDPETKHIPIIIYTGLEATQTEKLELDPRLQIIRKDEALDRLPIMVSELVTKSRKKTIAELLVIEDDQEIQQVVSQGLSNAGYSITVTTSGEEGLRLAMRQPFDLIMLDLMLPDIDGWTVLRQLRERTQTATTPLMLVSALGKPEEKVRGFQLGADDYITKPFDWNELLARISASLRRREVEGNANPSTMLPGNRAIERAIAARLDRKQPFVVAYCDLDHFKAYNDEYGFLKGDAIIHQTARIITGAVERSGAAGDFVGHIGGDDFVFLAHPDNVVTICESIIREFDQLAPLYYDIESRQRGFIRQNDREGNPKQFPFVSISIGVVSSLNHQITHFAEFGDLAADVKKRAKAHKGSVYLIETGDKATVKAAG